jgi:hypothetical protein
MLLEMHALHAKSVSAAFCERVKSAIAGATRETDLIGWYEDGRILAVIFAELNVDEDVPVAELLRSKIETVLANSVGAKAAARIVITEPSVRLTLSCIRISLRRHRRSEYPLW